MVKSDLIVTFKQLASMELPPTTVFEEPIFYPLKVVLTNSLPLKHISQLEKCFSTYSELVFFQMHI